MCKIKECRNCQIDFEQTFEDQDICEDCLDEESRKCDNCGNEKENEDEPLCRDCAWLTAGDRKYREDNEK